MTERLSLSDLTALVPHPQLVALAADKALGTGLAKLDELDAAIRATERQLQTVCQGLDLCNKRALSDDDPVRLKARRLRLEILDALGRLKAERTRVAALLLQPGPVGDALADAMGRAVPDTAPGA